MSDSNNTTFYTIYSPQAIFQHYVNDYESLNVYLNKCIEDYKKEHPKSNESNVFAWHTDYFTHQKTDVFKPLIDTVENYALYAANEWMNAGLDQPYKLYVSNLWCTKYKQNDYTRLHAHFPAVFSACYYVDVEENASPIIYGEDKSKFCKEFGADAWDKEGHKNITIQPKPGMLLLWQGSIPHRVERTFSNRTCICMNINIQWCDYE